MLQQVTALWGQGEISALLTGAHGLELRNLLGEIDMRSKPLPFGRWTNASRRDRFLGPQSDTVEETIVVVTTLKWRLASAPRYKRSSRDTDAVYSDVTVDGDGRGRRVSCMWSSSVTAVVRK